LTVAYSDSDDGVTQKSVIATSKLAFGRLTTVGRIERLAAAACAVSAGKLDVVRAAAIPSRRLYPTSPVR
jgi:hypothetical protein